MSEETCPQYRLDVAFSSAVVPLDKSKPILLVSYGWAERNPDGSWSATGQQTQTIERGACVSCRLIDLSIAGIPDQRSTVTEVSLCFGEEGPFEGPSNPRHRPLITIGPLQSEALNLDSRAGWYSFDLQVKSIITLPNSPFQFSILIQTSQNTRFQVDPEMIVGGPGVGPGHEDQSIPRLEEAQSRV
ncbi:MAG TPA: hypothetical protein VJX67_16620 [Blastocatellia bacterium]|nr:hypothetical protein [Blastocatellia bacterium]